MGDIKTENGVEITDEYFPVTIIETIGEHNAATDTISVRMEAHRDPDKVFVQPLSVMPAEMREAAKNNGFRFWAQADISVDVEQNGNESLKLSGIEPMGNK